MAQLNKLCKTFSPPRPTFHCLTILPNMCVEVMRGGGEGWWKTLSDILAFGLT